MLPILLVSVTPYVGKNVVALGIAEMELEGARLLTADEEAQLTAMLGPKMQRKVVIRQKTRPELLGGFILKRGDLQWDTSLSRRLARLVRRMAENKTAVGVWR